LGGAQRPAHSCVLLAGSTSPARETCIPSKRGKSMARGLRGRSWFPPFPLISHDAVSSSVGWGQDGGHLPGLLCTGNEPVLQTCWKVVCALPICDIMCAWLLVCLSIVLRSFERMVLSCIFLGISRTNYPSTQRPFTKHLLVCLWNE
jgi:hypothetical protein